MKLSTNADIADFVTGRTGQFEKDPPEHVWNNIRKNIPAYPVQKGAGKWYFYAGIPALLIITALVIYFAVLPDTKISDRQTNTKDLPAINNQIPADNSQNLVAEKSSETKNNSALNSNTVNEKETVKNIAATSSDDKGTILNSETGTSVSVSQDVSGHTTSGNQVVKNKKIYNISATGLENVKGIYFINSKDEVIISSKNPAPDSYGFYSIDISSIPSGTYVIKIETKEKVITHKKETF